LRQPARRLPIALTLTLSLGMLAAALLGPSQTLAQTHRPACSSAAARARAERSAHTCPRSSHARKSRTQARHVTRHHAKRAPAGKTPEQAPTSPAYCEDGSAPVRAGSGSFACYDGSEPECEDGATPTLSSNASSLVCAATGEGESSSSEVECQEGEASGCGGETGSGPGEQTCEAPAGDGPTSAVCEGESEA
jgi:hypothetical protein